MNLCNRPIYQKPEGNGKDPDYLDRVRELPCVACGVKGVEAHHCRDLPDHAEQGLYDRVPGAALKSADRDAIPLCPFHHRMFHLHRSDFHRDFGRDYTHIGPTRAAIDDSEVDF